MEEQEEASLFFLLKDAENRAELVARFMGVLELIKIHRITITSVSVLDEGILEYTENGLEMMFKLNSNYVPGDITESEFDIVPQDTITEDDDKEGQEE